MHEQSNFWILGLRFGHSAHLPQYRERWVFLFWACFLASHYFLQYSTKAKLSLSMGRMFQHQSNSFKTLLDRCFFFGFWACVLASPPLFKNFAETDIFLNFKQVVWHLSDISRVSRERSLFWFLKGRSCISAISATFRGSGTFLEFRAFVLASHRFFQNFSGAEHFSNFGRTFSNLSKFSKTPLKWSFFFGRAF